MNKISSNLTGFSIVDEVEAKNSENQFPKGVCYDLTNSDEISVPSDNE
ncbi:hypothetical protein [Pedobacter sp. SG908]|nr:hypothetical protein [Pedobacter sp. SG908]NII81202.1 hypothetical protein [Pedobacter sp. SG908]